MEISYSTHWPQFFTATIHEWKHLLRHDEQKDIIINSLKFLVDNKRINLYAYSIMSSHLHLIWQPQATHNPKDIQASFLRHTGKQLFRSLEYHPRFNINDFKVNRFDRAYQIWKRDALSIGLISAPVFNQKLEYIHYNPVKAGLCISIEEYRYSSARYYMDGIDEFSILTHYSGIS